MEFFGKVKFTDLQLTEMEWTQNQSKKKSIAIDTAEYIYDEMNIYNIYKIPGSHHTIGSNPQFQLNGRVQNQHT